MATYGNIWVYSSNGVYLHTKTYQISWGKRGFKACNVFFGSPPFSENQSLRMWPFYHNTGDPQEGAGRESSKLASAKVTVL